MLLQAHTPGVVARRLLAAGALLALAALLPGCSDAPPPATAAGATAGAAQPGAGAAEKAAAQPAAGGQTAGAQPGGAQAGATQVGVAPKPELKSPEAVQAAKGATAGAAGEAQTDAQLAEAKAAAAKAAAAKGPVDPMTDTDPNSKARVTYEYGADVVHFGKVMQGDVLTHKFVLQSAGEEDLIIKQSKPTCGCTVAQIMAQDGEGQMVPYQYGKPLPPGRRIEIASTLSTQSKRGHTSSKINVFTNDPRGQTILSLEADVDPFFIVTPPTINFQQLSQKDTATDKLTVATAKGQRIQLAAATENLPQGLKVELRPLDEDADGKSSRWELVATAGPGLVEGSLAYSVQLKSDQPILGGEKLPNGNLPTYDAQATITARVTGPISHNPQFVSLGLLRPGQTLSRSVRVTSHDNEFKLSQMEALIQGRDTAEWEHAASFTTVIRPVPNENAVDVEVTLNGLPDTVSGSFSGSLLLKIGHPDKPEIKIPLTGVCRGGAAAAAPTALPAAPAATPK